MIFLITFCAVVLLTVDEGLVIGIAFALLTVVFRTQWYDYFITLYNNAFLATN